MRAEVVTHDGRLGFRRQLGWQRESGGHAAGIVRQVARRYGIPLSDESLEMFTSPEDEVWAEDYVRRNHERPILLLSRHSSANYKEYPPERWQEVVDRFSCELTVLDLSEPKAAMRGATALWPFPSLRRVAALFRRVRCVAAVDTFAAHLAAAVGTPAVVLFGPADSECLWPCRQPKSPSRHVPTMLLPGRGRLHAAGLRDGDSPGSHRRGHPPLCERKH